MEKETIEKTEPLYWHFARQIEQAPNEVALEKVALDMMEQRISIKQTLEMSLALGIGIGPGLVALGGEMSLALNSMHNWWARPQVSEGAVLELLDRLAEQERGGYKEAGKIMWGLLWWRARSGEGLAEAYEIKRKLAEIQPNHERRRWEEVLTILDSTDHKQRGLAAMWLGNKSLAQVLSIDAMMRGFIMHKRTTGPDLVRLWQAGAENEVVRQLWRKWSYREKGENNWIL